MNTPPSGVTLPPDSQWIELKRTTASATPCPMCGSLPTQKTSQRKTTVEEQRAYTKGYMDAMNYKTPDKTLFNTMFYNV